MPRPENTPLTPVQIKVLRAAADGASLAVVAQRLSMANTQVASHLSRIYKRLGVHTAPLGNRPADRRGRRALAVSEARRRGLII